MKWFPLIQPWLDPKYQLITQPPPGYDGGDTSQREGSYALAIVLLADLGLCDDDELMFTRDRYNKVIALLNDPNHPGFQRRFPDPAYWGSHSDRYSRDQAIPNVIAMGLYNQPALKSFMWNHLKRALLFTTNTRENGTLPATNTLSAWQKVQYFFGWRPSYPVNAFSIPDLTALSFWSLYIRAFRAWPLYPLMLLFDLDLVVNSLIKVYSYGKNPQNNDDLNHINCLLQADISLPTPWSKLAKWIYRRRPYPALQPGQSASNPAQACLLAYFRGVNPGPKLEEVYQPLTDHYFK